MVAAIYTIMNTGMETRMPGIKKTWEMFTRISGNLLQYSRKCYHFNIPGKFKKISRYV